RGEAGFREGNDLCPSLKREPQFTAPVGPRANDRSQYMPFINDRDALSIGREIFSRDEIADFEACHRRLRELERCVKERTPSSLCNLTDPVENLNWCRVGVEIESLKFEDYMQRVIEASEESGREGEVT